MFAEGGTEVCDALVWNDLGDGLVSDLLAVGPNVYDPHSNDVIPQGICNPDIQVDLCVVCVKLAVLMQVPSDCLLYTSPSPRD